MDNTSGGMGSGIDNILRPSMPHSTVNDDRILKRPTTSGTKSKSVKTKPRNISLTDSTFRRLKLQSVQTDQTMSEVAEQILKDNLSRLSLRDAG